MFILTIGWISLYFLREPNEVNLARFGNFLNDEGLTSTTRSRADGRALTQEIRISREENSLEAEFKIIDGTDQQPEQPTVKGFEKMYPLSTIPQRIEKRLKQILSSKKAIYLILYVILTLLPVYASYWTAMTDGLLFIPWKGQYLAADLTAIIPCLFCAYLIQKKGFFAFATANIIWLTLIAFFWFFAYTGFYKLSDSIPVRTHTKVFIWLLTYFLKLWYVFFLIGILMLTNAHFRTYGLFLYAFCHSFFLITRWTFSIQYHPMITWFFDMFDTAGSVKFAFLILYIPAFVGYGLAWMCVDKEMKKEIV